MSFYHNEHRFNNLQLLCADCHDAKSKCECPRHNSPTHGQGVGYWCDRRPGVCPRCKRWSSALMWHEEADGSGQLLCQPCSERLLTKSMDLSYPY
jgi:hypothetical protein